MSETAGKITAADAGCWLDGAMGWHNTYRVFDRALELGWLPADLVAMSRIRDAYEDGEDYILDVTDGKIYVSEAMSEIAGEATDYLQSLAPAGYSFHWDDGLYLWADSDDDTF